MQTTITEALAELKTIQKRIDKKRQFVLSYLGRQEAARDPLEKDGGSVASIKAERQSISDLQERTVRIRRAIQLANEGTQIVIEGESRTIADWLVWRREVAPKLQEFLGQIRGGIENARSQAKKRDVRVVEAGQQADFNDIIINVSEAELASDIERIEVVLGTLDGQLSLKNATITISVD